MTSIGNRIFKVLAASLMAALTCAAAFSQAVELKKSTPASQRTYNTAAGAHNEGFYPDAAELWEMFLKQYPDDELAPQATHYLGICYMQMKPPKYAEAVKTYSDLRTKFPNFKSLADALLNLGWCQFQLGTSDKGMYAAADKTFDELIATEKHVDQALYFQGESRYLQGNRKEAIASYQKLIDEHPESNMRSDGLYALGVANEELGQFVEAGKIYDLYLTEFGEGDKVNPAIRTEVAMRKAETILQAGITAEEGGKADEAKSRFAEAEKLFASAAAVDGFASADHALSRQALAASKQGKFAEAGDLYAKVADAPKTVDVKAATMDAGRTYYQAKKFDEAAGRFRKLLELGGPDVPEAAHWLCRILIDQKKENAEAARLAAETIVKAEGNAYLVNLKLDEADAKFESPDTRTESLKLYADIAAVHADSPLAPQALYNAAYTALQLKQHDEALRQAGVYLEKYSDRPLAPDVKYVAAESHLFKKDYAQAEKLYADLAANYKQHADLEQWQLRLGLVQFLQKKYQETIDALAPVVGTFKSPDNIAEAQFYIGSSQYQLNAFDQAAAALSAAYAANPKWRRADEVLLDLARAQQKEGKLPEAATTVQKMLAEFPGSDSLDRAHFQLAQYSYDNGDFKTAAAEYGEVLAKAPNSIFAPHALYGKGWSEHRLDNNQAAIATFTALIDGHPEHRLANSARNGRGICRQRTGDFEGGLVDFTAFLATNPTGQDQADALYNRGLCEAGLKKFADAAKTYAAILKDHPDYAAADKVLYELGWAYKEEGNEAESVQQFAKLAADHPDSPLAAEALYHVGEDQYDNEKFADAAKTYTASQAKAGATELGEKATYKLGWANYRLGQYGEALKAFDAQVAAYPQGALLADALFMQGECNFKLENYAVALPAFEKALAAKPSSENVQVLCQLHGGQSAGQLDEPNWAKAVALLAPLETEHPDSPYLPEALYELGWASFNLQKPDDAQKYWTAAATQATGALGARSRFMLGEVKFTKKDFEGAVKDYRLVVFGFGGEGAEADVKQWQAKACLQAGQASAILAGQATDKKDRDTLVAEAKRYFQRVVEKYPQSDMATAAAGQLKKLGG